MPKAKLPWSKASFLAAIQKLNIQRGDVLLVKSIEVYEQLLNNPSPVDFNVPVIMDPNGVGIGKLTRQQLLDALDQLDLIDEKNAAKGA